MDNGAFFESLGLFNDRLTSEIIRLLDDSIEYIKYLGSDSVKFKRFGEREINISYRIIAFIIQWNDKRYRTIYSSR